MAIAQQINEAGSGDDKTVADKDVDYDPFSGIDDADLLAFNLDEAINKSVEKRVADGDDELGGGCVDSEYSEDDDCLEYEEDELKREYIAKIEAHFDQLHCTKHFLGVLIREGMDFFPDDMTFDDYREQLDNLFANCDSSDEEGEGVCKDENAGADVDVYAVKTGMGTVSDVTPKKLDFEMGSDADVVTALSHLRSGGSNPDVGKVLGLVNDAVGSESFKQFGEGNGGGLRCGKGADTGALVVE